MASRGQHGSKVPASRKAAQLYLDEGLGIPALRERFGISRGSILTAIYKLRRERGEQRPAGAP